MGNFNMIEKQVTIVHCVIAELWSNVTDIDTFKRLMGLHISDLTDKWMGAIAFPVKNQLSHHDCMIRSSS